MEEKMKKASLLTLLTLVMMITLLILVGCRKENKIAGISLKDYDPSCPIEMAFGDFNYDAHTLVVTHASGSTEEIALTEGMIAAEDQVKFYQEGEHDITISYEGQTFVFRISVKRSTFGNLKFPENNIFTYRLSRLHNIHIFCIL